MLCLSRKPGERISIRDASGKQLVEICVVAIIDQHKVRLGIQAPPELIINRKEVWDRMDGKMPE